MYRKVWNMILLCLSERINRWWHSEDTREERRNVPSHENVFETCFPHIIANTKQPHNQLNSEHAFKNDGSPNNSTIDEVWRSLFVMIFPTVSGEIQIVLFRSPTSMERWRDHTFACVCEHVNDDNNFHVNHSPWLTLVHRPNKEVEAETKVMHLKVQIETSSTEPRRSRHRHVAMNM